MPHIYGFFANLPVHTCSGNYDKAANLHVYISSVSYEDASKSRPQRIQNAFLPQFPPTAKFYSSSSGLLLFILKCNK